MPAPHSCSRRAWLTVHWIWVWVWVQLCVWGWGWRMGLRTRTVDVTVVVVVATILGVLNARRALLPTAPTSRPPALSLWLTMPNSDTQHSHWHSWPFANRVQSHSESTPTYRPSLASQATYPMPPLDLSRYRCPRRCRRHRRFGLLRRRPSSAIVVVARRADSGCTSAAPQQQQQQEQITIK